MQFFKEKNVGRLNFLKFTWQFCQKQWFQTIHLLYSILKRKINRFLVTKKIIVKIYHKLAIIDQNFSENYERCEQNNGSYANNHKNLSPRHSSEKKFKYC